MFNIVNKHQKLVKSMMIFIIITFIVWGIGSYVAMMNSDNNYIAKVGNKKIYQKDINNVLAQNKQYTKDDALFVLINRQLIINNADHYSLLVDNNQLRKQIMKLSFLQNESGIFESRRYQLFLSQNNINAINFQHEIANQIVIDQTVEMFSKSYFASDIFLKKFAEYLSKERNIETYTLNSDQFKNLIHINNEQINNYYQQNINNFSVSDSLQFEYIELSIDNIKSSLKNPTLAEIDDYIKHHQHELLITNKPNNKINNKVELSNINKTVIDRIKQQQALKELQQDIEKLNDLAYSNPDNLMQTAKYFHTPIDTTAWVYKNEINKLTNITAAQNMILDDEVIKNHHNSEVINWGNNIYRVYRLKSLRPSYYLAIATVREKIINELTAMQIQTLMQKTGDKYINELQQKKIKLNFTNKQNINLLTQNNVINPAIIKQIFAIKLTKEGPSYTGAIDQNQQFIIYKINQEVINYKLVTQNYNTLKQFSMNNSMLDFNAYLNGLKSKYAVNVFKS